MLLTWVGFVESLKKNSQKKKHHSGYSTAAFFFCLTRVIADRFSVMLAAMYIKKTHKKNRKKKHHSGYSAAAFNEGDSRQVERDVGRHVHQRQPRHEGGGGAHERSET